MRKNSSFSKEVKRGKKMTKESCFVLLYAFVFLINCHTIADFIIQTRWQAQNKSKNWKALFGHIFSYTAFMGFCSSILILPFVENQSIFSSVLWKSWAIWTCFNGLCHLFVDAITSRMTSFSYYAAQNEPEGYAKDEYMKGFWTWIGVDQLIHIATLMWSYVYIMCPYEYLRN